MDCGLVMSFGVFMLSGAVVLILLRDSEQSFVLFLQ